MYLTVCLLVSLSGSPSHEGEGVSAGQVIISVVALLPYFFLVLLRDMHHARRPTDCLHCVVLLLMRHAASAEGIAEWIRLLHHELLVLVRLHLLVRHELLLLWLLAGHHWEVHAAECLLVLLGGSI